MIIYVWMMDGRLGVFVMAVTLVQVAERAGLSPATVSLTLRNKSVGKKRFSPKTISKIQRIAKEMGISAGKLLMDIMNGIPWDGKPIILPVEVKLRKTTRVV